MKKTVATLAAALALSGCAGTTWKSSTTTDEFTDTSTAFVTTSGYRPGAEGNTNPPRYFPVVRNAGGQVYVGLMTGGNAISPTGTVQLRIDQHEAWTITPEETPISMVPSFPNDSAPGSAALASPSKEQVENAAKIMSPYTLAGGDKAKQILKQMLTGHTIKFRTVGMNQAASATGDAALDESFRKSIVAVGINPAEL